MKTFLFTIYDSVSKKPGPVFATFTIGEAERQFHDALQRSEKGSLFHSHPQDFSLRLLGEFDTEEVKITSTNSQIVATGQKSEPEAAA